MRSLASASVTPINDIVRASHQRRQIRSVFNSLTCLAVFKHDESDTQLYVSHNDDPLCAVWIKKNPLLLDPRFTGSPGKRIWSRRSSISKNTCPRNASKSAKPSMQPIGQGSGIAAGPPG